MEQDTRRSVPEAILALLSGVVFSVGLALAGMTQPAKVLGFLDFTGAWDPSLAFVMVGAIAVYFVAYRIARTRHKPWVADLFHVPTRNSIDGDLVVGAALFGIGWGLAGYCPGPALSSLVTLGAPVCAFVFSMAIGIWLCAALRPGKAQKSGD